MPNPLIPDVVVQDIVEPTESRLLDKDGVPLPYRRQGQGFVGFFQLKERR